MATENRTRDFFDRYAKGFDAIYGNRNSSINKVVNRFLRKSMRLRFEKTIQGCSPIQGKSALDVGCGPGHYAVALAKCGARRVLGTDVAEGMLQLAAEHSRNAGVADICEFRNADFNGSNLTEKFDYVILMGLMDYMPDPEAVVEKVISLTRCKAFLSFPAAGGFLAWQRAKRYQKRCELYLYREDRIRELFSSFPGIRMSIEPIARDYFVTVQAT